MKVVTYTLDKHKQDIEQRRGRERWGMGASCLDCYLQDQETQGHTNLSILVTQGPI